MSLIKCPECGKEISDKAKACINCGYPLENENKNICMINGKNYDLSFIFDTNKYDRAQATGVLRRLVGCNVDRAVSIVDKIRETKEIPISITIPDSDLVKSKPQIKCPTCSSTDVEKISSTERAGSVFLLGMFSKKINKSFKCKNCGYTW